MLSNKLWRCVTQSKCLSNTVLNLRKISSSSLSSLSFSPLPSFIQDEPSLAIQKRHFAARKGTRARKEKKKTKVVEVKKTFNEKLIESQKLMTIERPVDDSNKDVAVDDVYFYSRFQEKTWSIEEAVKNHKETHHINFMNRPNAGLILRIDIDLVYPNRLNKYVDNWRSIVEMQEPFVSDGVEVPKILAFCPDDEALLEATIKAGADTVGGTEIIKLFQTGEMSVKDFEYIVCHIDMAQEISNIRGLLKGKFPGIKNNTMSNDLPAIVQKFKRGIRYYVRRFDHEPDFGYVEQVIGTLDMECDGLEGNFARIIFDAVNKRPPGKSPHEFIIKASLRTKYSPESFKIDLTPYFAQLKATGKKGNKDEDKSLESVKEMTA